MIRKIRPFLYVFVILCFLSLIAKSLFLNSQKDVSIMENRNLVTKEDLKGTNFMDGSFQKTLENMLTDQFPMRNDLVMAKRQMDQKIILLFSGPKSENYKLTLIGESNRYRIGDTNYLMYKPMEENEEIKTKITRRAQQINALKEKYPELGVYVYHPLQAQELNVYDEYNENIISYGEQYNELLQENLTVPYLSSSINSFDDYKQKYYSSDHHWNNYGSYQGYLDICKLLGVKEDPLKPREIIQADYPFYGSHANFTGRVFGGDKFEVFTFDYKPFKVFKNIDEPTKYNYPNNFSEKECEEDDYFYNDAYGLYSGLVHIDTSEYEKENILVVGDSYMGPISSLISQHFNNSYFLSPTPYFMENYHIFDYEEFINNHDIDKVLFMYTIENYFYEDEWGEIYKNFDVILENEGDK